MDLENIVNLARHPIDQSTFASECKTRLDSNGVLVLRDFLNPKALEAIRQDSLSREDDAYFCSQNHSVYLTPPNPDHSADHPANRQVTSSKGCICDDEVTRDSALRILYESQEFQSFIAQTTGQAALFPYADSLSSINVHFARRGQELGWHFDNSSFAITLLIQKPEAGSHFEYVKDLRDADQGDMNYDGVADLLAGTMAPETLSMEPGTLVLFRGRNSIHRVTPNESDTTRILAVLAYNAEPGVSLSESARMTFYGRLD